MRESDGNIPGSVNYFCTKLLVFWGKCSGETAATRDVVDFDVVAR
jgi:hypothetical protein